MKFSTKKDLLRYLGKNEDDRKLIDRMVARGEVKVEGRLYVIEDKKAATDDLEYLNKEYEKLEGLLDYSLRKCYNIMRKRGLISSDDTYDNFYNEVTKGYRDENITEGYNRGNNISEENERRGEDTESSKADLNEVLKKFNLGYASRSVAK